MIRKIILVGALFFAGFLFGNLVKAADINGYTAQYECRSGGPNCNVDVVSYGNAACQQTIHTSDTWSTINWAADVICIEAGDHTAKGTLTLGSSGTSGTRKVLRYTRSGDSDDDPWDQTAGNKAKMLRVDLNGHDYWIIHRLTFDGDNAEDTVPMIYGGNLGSTYNIINRVLLEEGWSYGGVHAIDFDSTDDNNTVQNSVIRLMGKTTIGVGTPWGDNMGVFMGGADFTHIVNNEIYDTTEGVFCLSGSGSDNCDGTIIENNDVYRTTATYTDCAGNLDVAGPCSNSRSGIKFKNGGTSANPIHVIHNRVWGMRYTDAVSCCLATEEGEGLVWSTDYPDTSIQGDYVNFENNIITDMVYAILVPRSGPNNGSAIGNLIYDINAQGHSTVHSAALAILQGPTVSEFYLNTIISVTEQAWTGSSFTDNDVRCNVFISAGAKTGSFGTGTQVDYNTYYDSTHNGETNKIDKTVSTRANSTAYSLNAVIRTTATAPANGTSGDFEYMVTTAGTSASSPPAYTTTCGGTTTDGTMTVRAIHCPYSYWRKLLTTAEQKYIPYAKIHNSAPEYQQCTAANMGSALGSRSGVGYNDDTVGF